jgi:hypothetical protein
VALTGVSLMIATGVLNWQDVLEEKPAWDILFWMGAVVGLAGLLAQFGAVKVFAEWVKGLVGDLDWRVAFFFVAIVYCYCQYFFASGTARVTALFSAFASVLVLLGAPPLYTTLMFGMLGGVGITLTHYGSRRHTHLLQRRLCAAGNLVEDRFPHLRGELHHHVRHRHLVDEGDRVRVGGRFRLVNRFDAVLVRRSSKISAQASRGRRPSIACHPGT